jgi:hypothetical protein
MKARSFDAPYLNIQVVSVALVAMTGTKWMELGTIIRINARGRVAVEITGWVVVADIQSGGGGWIGDAIEGDMRPGPRTWRNITTGSLTVVQVIAVVECDLRAQALLQRSA